MQTGAVQGDDARQPFLLVTHGSWICALPVSETVEVLRPLPIESLPGAPEGVLGVSIVRGQPVPVAGLGSILGSSGGEPGRFVVLKLGARRAVLAVESVLGVRRLPAANLRDVPPLLRDANPDVIAGIASLDQMLMVALEAGRVIPSELWEVLGART